MSVEGLGPDHRKIPVGLLRRLASEICASADVPDVFAGIPDDVVDRYLAGKEIASDAAEIDAAIHSNPDLAMILSAVRSNEDDAPDHSLVPEEASFDLPLFPASALSTGPDGNLEKLWQEVADQLREYRQWKPVDPHNPPLATSEVFVPEPTETATASSRVAEPVGTHTTHLPSPEVFLHERTEWSIPVGEFNPPTRGQLVPVAPTSELLDVHDGGVIDLAKVKRRRRTKILVKVASIAACIMVPVGLAIAFEVPDLVWDAVRVKGKNEILTTQAFAAYDKATQAFAAYDKQKEKDYKAAMEEDYKTAKERAEECVKEFKGDAERLQAKLAEEGAVKPPIGSASWFVRRRIHQNGLLNDVATSWWLIGRCAGKLGQMEEARQAYQRAQKLTYARCWDPKMKIFWSPALKAGDDLDNLDEASQK
jgi:hypothetical protein